MDSSLRAFGKETYGIIEICRIDRKSVFDFKFAVLAADIFLKPLAEAGNDLGRVFVAVDIGEILAERHFKIGPELKIGVDVIFEAKPCLFIGAVIGPGLQPFIEFLVRRLEALFDVETVSDEKDDIHSDDRSVAVKETAEERGARWSRGCR